MEEVITVHDVEMSPYEQYVNHPITGEHVPKPLAFPGYAEPDNCPDCLVNPELGKRVHAAELALTDSLNAMKVFFSDNIDNVLLMKIFMSWQVSFDAALAERYADAGF